MNDIKIYKSSKLTVGILFFLWIIVVIVTLLVLVGVMTNGADAGRIFQQVGFCGLLVAITSFALNRSFYQIALEGTQLTVTRNKFFTKVNTIDMARVVTGADVIYTYPAGASIAKNDYKLYEFTDDTQYTLRLDVNYLSQANKADLLERLRAVVPQSPSVTPAAATVAASITPQVPETPVQMLTRESEAEARENRPVVKAIKAILIVGLIIFLIWFVMLLVGLANNHTAA